MLLAVTGLLTLVLAGGFLLWTRQAGTRQAQHTVRVLEKQWQQAPPPTTKDPIPDRAFALMTVPRFGADWVMPVFEGTGSASLRGGVGHYRGTALPGAIGNFAVAGHRTTWARPFREVDRLREGDEVVVRTRGARFTYRVTDHEIVRPGHSDVLDPVPGDPDAPPDRARLTLTTCHPEYSAWQRWIVHAVLVTTTPTTTPTA